MDPYIFEKCNGCRFFLHRSGRGCICRRYPTPTPTSEDGWCGEWQEPRNDQPNYHGAPAPPPDDFVVTSKRGATIARLHDGRVERRAPRLVETPNPMRKTWLQRLLGDRRR